MKSEEEMISRLRDAGFIIEYAPMVRIYNYNSTIDSKIPMTECYELESLDRAYYRLFGRD